MGSFIGIDGDHEISQDQNIAKTNRANYNHKRFHNVTREDATRWNNNSKDGIYY